MDLPDRTEILAAAARLDGMVHRTPLLGFRSAARADSSLFLKCENLQKTGAFKARGALHYLLRLQESAPGTPGVATYSSGNHGAALAWAAGVLAVPCTVFVPETIPASKRAAIAGYGGTVVSVGTTSLHRREAAESAAAEHGLHIVPPFDHPWIIAGQGTAGVEILEQLPSVGCVYVPVGGGGLFSGIAIAIKERSPQTRLVGVEPTAAASLQAALGAGRPVPIELGATIADGLCPVQTGQLCLAVASRYLDDLVTVTDAEILASLQFLIERSHLWVEPSGAAALAGYWAHAEHAGDEVVILSGGNLDLSRLAQLFARADGDVAGPPAP